MTREDYIRLTKEMTPFEIFVNLYYAEFKPIGGKINKPLHIGTILTSFRMFAFKIHNMKFNKYVEHLYDDFISNEIGLFLDKYFDISILRNNRGEIIRRY